MIRPGVLSRSWILLNTIRTVEIGPVIHIRWRRDQNRPRNSPYTISRRTEPVRIPKSLVIQDGESLLPDGRHNADQWYVKSRVAIDGATRSASHLIGK